MSSLIIRPWITLVRLFLGTCVLTSPLHAQNIVHAYPAPPGEPLSTQFKVTAEQTDVPVYLAQICSLSPEQRKTLKTPAESQTSTTSFASFDMSGQVKVSVTCTDNVSSAKLLPASSGITPEFSGKTVTFTVTKPGQLTLEVNGNWINSLHVFADPLQTDIPDPKDPHVIYFGPGIHHVQSVPVTSGQTVYIAGGAIVYGESGPDKPGAPIFQIKGSAITLRGRGIIDGSLCQFHTRSIMGISGTDITIEGVTLRDSSGWTMPVRKSDQVMINNVKIFGWRGNSDGIDICNSREVVIDHCFLRTFDDLIVLKTDKGQGELRDVTAKHCVLWNEFAHALSLGAELREPLSNVLFSDCDIIHDKGREWLLRVYNCDSAPVQNVIFDNIRVEEARRLMSLWIGKALWSKENDRGHIDNITFQDISFPSPALPGPFADLIGFDASHVINHVQFRNVTVGGQTLKSSDVHQNTFVHDVSVTP